MTLACLDISSKKRCIYRLFIYHFKAHTVSNKLVLKISAQKKGGKSYDSDKYVFKFFCGLRYSPPLNDEETDLQIPSPNGRILATHVTYMVNSCQRKIAGVIL